MLIRGLVSWSGCLMIALSIYAMDRDQQSSFIQLLKRDASIKSLAISPDGLTCALSHKERFGIYDLEKQSSINDIKIQCAIERVVFVPHENRLLGVVHTKKGNHKQVIKVWDVRSNQCGQKIICTKDPLGIPIVINSDGKGCFEGWDDGTIRWCADSEKLHSLQYFCPNFPMQGLVEWNKKEGELVSGAILGLFGPEARVAHLYFLANFVVMTTLRGHAKAITSLALSADGSMLASGSLDKTVKAWHIHQDEGFQKAQLKQEVSFFKMRPTALTFDSEKKWVISGFDDGSVKLVSTQSMYK